MCIRDRLEVLNVLYDEVDGCSFYDYIFPDNQDVYKRQVTNYLITVRKKGSETEREITF